MSKFDACIMKFVLLDVCYYLQQKILILKDEGNSNRGINYTHFPSPRSIFIYYQGLQQALLRWQSNVATSQLQALMSSRGLQLSCGE